MSFAAGRSCWSEIKRMIPAQQRTHDDGRLGKEDVDDEA
jgi:hypothetical protein